MIAVIGAGQAALATGYYLLRAGLPYVILDVEPGPGGAWRHTWESLALFSPPNASSLPGWLLPPTAGDYPTRGEFLAYLAAYERRYDLPVERGVRVTAVRRVDGESELILDVERVADSAASRLPSGASRFTLAARAVVSATGTWSNPVVPDVPGRDDLLGRQLHSAHYSLPA